MSSSYAPKPKVPELSGGEGLLLVPNPLKSASGSIAVSPNLLSDIAALQTTASNHTSAIFELENKTRYQSSDATHTVFEKMVQADSLKITNGLSTEFLMANGSVLARSTIDDRIASIENKTANITRTGQVTNVTELNMQNNRVTNVADPSADGDAVSKRYLTDKDYATSTQLDIEVLKLDAKNISQDASLAATDLTVAGHTIAIAGIETEIVALEAEIAAVAAVTAAISGVSSLLTAESAAVTYLPVSGESAMKGTLNMGEHDVDNVHNIRASGFIRTGAPGTGLGEFIKSDGTFDSTTYLSSTSPDITQLQTKTQNITSSQFSTALAGSVSITDTTPQTRWTTAETMSTYSISNQANPYGAEFSVDQTTSISAIYIQMQLYTDSTPRTFRFWRVSGPGLLIGDYTVTKTNLQNGNYVTNLETPLILTPGTYRFGVAVPANTPTITSGGFTFASGIKSVSAVWANNFEPAGYPAYYTFPAIPNLSAIGGFFSGIVQPGTLSASSIVAPSVTASAFKRTDGGSAAEFLKSNGTFDSSSYITATDPAITTLQAVATTLQEKTTGLTYNGTTTTVIGGVIINGALTVPSFIKTGGGASTEFLKSNGTFDSTPYLSQVNAASTYATTSNFITLATTVAGKLALTGGVLTGNVTAPQFIRTGGTSAQFLKADGSIDSATYMTAPNTFTQRGGRIFSKISNTNTSNATMNNFDLIGAYQGTLVIPANDMTVGDIYVFTVSGTWNLASGSNVSFNFGLCGSIQSYQLQFNPSVSNGVFEVKSTWVCRTTGTGGTCSASTIGYSGLGGNTGYNTIFGVQGTQSVNTTVAGTPSVTWTNPTYTTCNVSVYNLTLVKQ